MLSSLATAFCSILLILLLHGPTEVQCVQGCSIFFDANFKWKRAMCDSEVSKLRTIPPDLPDNLIELRIIHQRIVSLSNSNALQGLHNLEVLVIESSALERIHPNAFFGLDSIKSLKLRNNSLRIGRNGLQPLALTHLPLLEELNLAENPIDFIPDLFFASAGTVNLRRLWLNGCKAPSQQIEPRAFTSLYKLELLDLSVGKLRGLDRSTVEAFNSMPNLTFLFLNDNPWHCDCELFWLRQWQATECQTNLHVFQYKSTSSDTNVTTQPECYSPPAMRSKALFISHEYPEIENRGFGCKPKALTNNQVLNVSYGDHKLLDCAFFSEPSGAIYWYRDSHVLVKEEEIDQQDFVSGFVETKFSSSLPVVFNSSRANETIRCEFTSKQGLSASVNFHVLVHNHGSMTASLSIFGSSEHQVWIYIGIGLGVLLLVLGLVAVVIFYCCDPRVRYGMTGLGRLLKRPTESKSSNLVATSDSESKGLDEKSNDISAVNREELVTNTSTLLKKKFRQNDIPSFRAATPDNGRNSPLAVLRLQQAHKHTSPINNNNKFELQQKTEHDGFLIRCDPVESRTTLLSGTNGPTIHSSPDQLDKSTTLSSQCCQTLLTTNPFIFQTQPVTVSQPACKDSLSVFLPDQAINQPQQNVKHCPVHGDIVLTDHLPKACLTNDQPSVAQLSAAVYSNTGGGLKLSPEFPLYSSQLGFTPRHIEDRRDTSATLNHVDKVQVYHSTNTTTDELSLHSSSKQSQLTNNRKPSRNRSIRRRQPSNRTVGEADNYGNSHYPTLPSSRSLFVKQRGDMFDEDDSSSLTANTNSQTESWSHPSSSYWRRKNKGSSRSSIYHRGSGYLTDTETSAAPGPGNERARQYATLPSRVGGRSLRSSRMQSSADYYCYPSQYGLHQSTARSQRDIRQRRDSTGDRSVALIRSGSKRKIDDTDSDD